MKPLKVYYVARREILARVRSWEFVFSTLTIPLVLALLAVVPSLLFRADAGRQRVALLDMGTGLGSGVAAQLTGREQPAFDVVETVVVEEERQTLEKDRLLAAVRRGHLDGVLAFWAQPDGSLRARFYARATSNLQVNMALHEALQRGALGHWLAGSGIPPDRVSRLSNPETLEAVTLRARGEEEGGFRLAWLSTIVFVSILYCTAAGHSWQMASALVEERATRLIDLLIGAVTATELMTGKILGVATVGLLQIALWAACGVLAAASGLTLGPMAGGHTDSAWRQLVDAERLGWLVLFFLLEYLLYATLFAATGALCESAEELGSVLTPVAMPLFVAFVAAIHAVVNPASPATRILSLIPLTGPLVMFVRITVLRPPAWEIALGLITALASAGVAMWGASKVFKVSLLSHGTPITLPRVLRALRG